MSPRRAVFCPVTLGAVAADRRSLRVGPPDLFLLDGGIVLSTERMRDITVAAPAGTMEGAAGSSYYKVPTVVTGTNRDQLRPSSLERAT